MIFRVLDLFCWLLAAYFFYAVVTVTADCNASRICSELSMLNARLSSLDNSIKASGVGE